MDTAGPPQDDVAVPDAIVALAAGRTTRPVWRNAHGGLTFEIGEDPERRFVKWVPSWADPDLAGEAARMRWAASFVRVPAVVAVDDDESGQWLVTEPVEGESAVSGRWRRDPARAVAAVGVGLRLLHDRAPVDECPFSWTTEERVHRAHARAAAGNADPARWHPVHASLRVVDALAVLDAPPSTDRLVVAHGDACAPNTIVASDGRCAGIVDLGALGVADRWADLAIATWSAEWNYGPGWESILLDAYGVEQDPERTAYYRLLWDLT